MRSRQPSHVQEEKKDTRIDKEHEQGDVLEDIARCKDTVKAISAIGQIVGTNMLAKWHE